MAVLIPADEPFVISIDPEGVWHHSRFPHPLITVDYDEADRVIQVVALGPPADRLCAVLTDLIQEHG